jgi:hypothetical protein
VADIGEKRNAPRVLVGKLDIEGGHVEDLAVD